MKSRTTREEDFRNKVNIGYKIMKEKEVAICGLARDCEVNLKVIIPTVEKIANSFRRYNIVVCENDSVDRTRQVLTEWQQRDPQRVHIINGDSVGASLDHSANGSFSAFSRGRIERIAKCRNTYLNFLEFRHWCPDYVIVIDMDLAAILVDGIANTFGQHIPWDSVSSNGQNISTRNFDYYDAYALKEVGDSRTRTENIVYSYQNTMSGLQPGTPLIRVASGFNGLSVYRYEAIKGIRYSCMQNKDKIIKAWCEHVAFHDEMKKKGFDAIYINPAQVVSHFKPKTFIKRLHKKICSKLSTK